jgi:hypothetical protein
VQISTSSLLAVNLTYLPSFNLPLLAMIPPCDPSILDQNPQFKRLYENLTTNLLNPDGSTRAHTADPGRRAVVDVRRNTAASSAHYYDLRH